MQFGSSRSVIRWLECTTLSELTAGTIETNINKDDLANPKKREDMSRRIPLGRLGEPDDIAQPVVFFASDMAKYCTGASLLVDGGAAISLQ